jgi:hypothetical protein
VSKAILEAYDDAHSTALEMGYPSLTEALEDLADIKSLRDAARAEIEKLREACQRARVLLLKPWSSEDVDDARFILSAALAQETQT